MGQALYQKMYGVLCGAISDAVDALQEPTNAEHVRTMLVTAMLKTICSQGFHKFLGSRQSSNANANIIAKVKGRK